ncbi:patatin-like phospholipase family protein [Dactylosporangium sp. NPDC005572]|uniref:patatin-like phospholipase family protein n=1 Tax=Dactylosporangium sp. NPDC005572 TaxID=3156889 RepID=UPI0033B818ED
MATALVLGGGGVVGVAWETGVLTGLAEAGLDLRDAGLVVGTSAGAVVGAQITSGLTLPELYSRQLAPPTGELAAAMGPKVLLRYAAAAVHRSDRAALAHLGHLALRARTVPEEERRAVIAGRLPVHAWPDPPRLRVTAVDAETGEEVVFDAASGVDLVSAVAASCAVPIVWPTVTIDGRRYMDGGVRSPAHVHLAAGCDRVIVLAPITGGIRRSGRVAVEIAALGPDVRSLVVTPDPEARAAMGRNALDPARRAASARAGHRQAATLVDAVTRTLD